MKRILPFALAVLFTGCATSPDVRTDFDPGAHFASYHTYTWLGKPTGISPLVEQRIEQGVDAHLQAKGWQPAGSADTADVAVVANTATQQRQTLDTFYTGGGYAGWGWRGGMGMGMGSSTTTVRTYNEGTLIVDLFDAKSKQAIWRGTATATVSKSPSDVNATVQVALDKMFANFPPGTAPVR